MSLNQATFSAGTSLFGGLIRPAPKTYATWPVWHDSTTKEVKFQPMKKKEAVILWHKARQFERQTRQPGKQDGALGSAGLKVLHSLLFDSLNYLSGALYPSYATIAENAATSVSSVWRGLKKLKEAGVRELATPLQGGLHRRALYLDAGEQRLRGAAQLAMERL